MDVRRRVEKAKQALPGVGIRLTGEVVLEHDELVNVQESTNAATIASIILVCVALLAGFRSWKLMLVTLASMLMGLSLALGFATWSVGHLNLISIAFAVLYIGVGDDYAIQLNLRYRELLQQQLPQKEALLRAVRDIGPSIALCAITTSLGFFSFIPTDYVGVAELGVIAGGGILIALFISITVIPALLRLFPLRAGEKPFGGSFPAWVYDFPMRHALFIKWTALGVTLAGIGLLTQARFDFNPLNLRNPESESVATFRELLKTKTSSPMTLSVLAAGREEAQTVAQRLEKLKTVEEAVTIFDFIPTQQEPKLEVIQELALVMGLRFSEFPPPMPDSIENHRAALTQFIDTADRHLKKNPGSELAEPLQRLQKVLSRLLTFIESKPLDDQEALLNRLQRNLLGALPWSMNKLWKGFEADRVTLAGLPKELSERWLSKDGIYRIQAFPSKDLNERDNLKAFVKEVRQIAPHATDLPVIYLESADAVVRSFLQALLFTLAAIVTVLSIVTRSIKDTLLILLPLLMTAILTGAATVVLDTPFNFANIIVIPLLLGLGVDSGIYIVSRLRALPDQQQNVLRTSTARGVVFSCLTTVGSLVSMAFTSHPGLASMGLLLSVGLSLVIVCTIVVLPAYAYKVRG